MNFDQPLRLRHTKHYAVFHDQQAASYATSDLRGVYQTARQAFIAVKRLRLDCYDGFIYRFESDASLIHDNGIGLLRVLDGSYVGWGYQFCVPGEDVLVTLRVKATFVYHEDVDPNYDDEEVSAAELPDDFTEWMLHCEIPFDEVEDGPVEQTTFHNVNVVHADDDDGEESDGLGGRRISEVD